jgi:MFS-type transporter involved in bile tolerance (Atg22 family)
VTQGEIEQAKHMATWCNSLATAAISAGVLTPAVAYLAGTASTVPNIGVICVISGICILAAFALNDKGSQILAVIP